MERICVVGASLAGLRAIETLRAGGFAGHLSLIGAEAHLPYDRPPLSKEFLAGEWDHDRTVLRRAPYDDLDVELRLGVRAHRLDVAGRAVELDGGERIAFDGLIIATGATPRTLPFRDLDGVFTLRTLDDAMALRARLDDGARVVIIGAGFIGAEVAATCRKRGLSVTLLEALAQPMVRGIGPRIGARLAQLHRDEGVDLRLGVTVDDISGDGRVERVRLADGEEIDADVVLVAVGVVAETSWLEGSGLTLDNGVVCDERLMAAPGIAAAGDVCRWPNAQFGGELMRLEHWTNATEQGVFAATSLLAHSAGESVAPFAPVPFVWSDQYDVKIQCVGRFGPDDDLEIVHGDLSDERFVALFGRDDRLVGALAFSRPRQLMGYRRMVADGASFSEALAHAADST